MQTAHRGMSAATPRAGNRVRWAPMSPPPPLAAACRGPCSCFGCASRRDSRLAVARSCRNCWLMAATAAWRHIECDVCQNRPHGNCAIGVHGPECMTVGHCRAMIRAEKFLSPAVATAEACSTRAALGAQIHTYEKTNSSPPASRPAPAPVAAPTAAAAAAAAVATAATPATLTAAGPATAVACSRPPPPPPPPEPPPTQARCACEDLLSHRSQGRAHPGRAQRPGADGVR